MAFQIPTEQVQKLDQMHSECMFKHRTVNGADVTICHIRDKHMGKMWARGEAVGSDDEAEKAALTDALNKAMPGDRPKTPAELAEENAKLRKELAELKGEEAPKPAAAPKAIPAVSDDKPDQPPADPLADLSNNDIVKMLTDKGLDIPEGDRRTNKWRQQAAELLQS